jgi:hypothetical protein
MTMLSSTTRLLRIIAMVFPLMLTLNGPLHGQVVTIAGAGTTAEWRTYAGGSYTIGAPAILEAAFPVGAPFTATLTYDVANVTLSFSDVPTSRYYRGHDLVTAMSIQASGHTVSPDPDSIFQAAASQLLVINEPPADYLFGSRDGVIDGSKTFAGYRVVFAVVGITDFDATALADISLPAAVCPGEWEQLEVWIGLVEGESPGEILYQLRGFGFPDRSVDSDRDALSDGIELGSGSNPCHPDTDGDGLNDGVDPNPLVPRSSTDALADAVRTSATGVIDIPESSFAGPNEHAQRGRRNSLANQLQSAANAIEEGNLEDALSILEHVLDRLDGNPAPPDVMEDGPAKDALREEVERLIALVRAGLGR